MCIFAHNARVCVDDIAMDIPLPEGIDYIGFYINEWDNQIVYVRAGKINERVAYRGDEDLREYVDVIIDDVVVNFLNSLYAQIRLIDTQVIQLHQKAKI